MEKFGNLVKYLFLYGLFISHFVFWPFGDVAYEVPKVWFIVRWIEVFVLTSLVTLSSPKVKKNKIDSILTIFVIAFLISVYISSLQGASFIKSLWGNYYRADGLITLSHLVILFASLAYFFQKKWTNSLATAISVASFLLSILTLIDWTLINTLGVNLFDSLQNVPSLTFGNSNFLGGYLATTLPFTLHLVNTSKRKNVWKYTLLTQSLAIIATYSIGSILTMLLFFWVIGILHFKKKLLFIAGLLFFLLILLFGMTKTFRASNESSENPTLIVAESRERIFKKGLLSLKKRTILGWGWANFDYAFDSVEWPVKLNDDVYVDKAHSQILEILVTGGILSLLLYIAIVARTFVLLKSGRHKFNKTLLIFLILYLFHSQTNIISISEELIFWITLGLSAKKL